MNQNPHDRNGTQPDDETQPVIVPLSQKPAVLMEARIRVLEDGSTEWSITSDDIMPRGDRMPYNHRDASPYYLLQMDMAMAQIRRIRNRRARQGGAK